MSRARMWRLLVWLFGVYIAAGVAFITAAVFFGWTAAAADRSPLAAANLSGFDLLLLTAADEALVVHTAVWAIVSCGIAIAAASARGRRIAGRTIAVWAGAVFTLAAAHAVLLLIGADQSPLHAPQGSIELDYHEAIQIMELHAVQIIPVLGVLTAWSRDHQ